MLVITALSMLDDWAVEHEDRLDAIEKALDGKADKPKPIIVNHVEVQKPDDWPDIETFSPDSFTAVEFCSVENPDNCEACEG